MAEEDSIQDEPLPAVQGAGERLRQAREEAGMSLAQIAAETRIPERHLSLIDTGEFDALPARTYAVGFSRSYAKAVGLDPREIAEQVRDELGRTQPAERNRPVTFEPGDPARVPSRGLAVFSLLAIILLIVGGFMFYRTYLAPGAGPPPIVAETQPAASERLVEQRAGRQQPQPSGPVTFTAVENDVWVRFYDGEGERLYEAIMQQGDEFTVPADAENPQIWTGRPHELAITIGGQPVPKLADTEQIVRDIPVSAQALLQRGRQPAQPAQSAPPDTVPDDPSPGADQSAEQ